MTSEDTDASNGGEQFDVSNILADYFKDKIRQGIGVGDDGQSVLSEGKTSDSGDVVEDDNKKTEKRARTENVEGSPERKRSKKDKKTKKKKKTKKHKHHNHSYDKQHSHSKSSSSKNSTDNKNYCTANRTATENDSRIKESKDGDREPERSRNNRSRSGRKNDTHQNSSCSSSGGGDEDCGGRSMHRRNRSRDRARKSSKGRGERRRSREPSSDGRCSRSRSRDRKQEKRHQDAKQKKKRDRSRSLGRFRSPLRVRESAARGSRAGEGRKNEEVGLGAGFDKKELLEVARRNVKVMIQTGTLPKGVDVEKLGLDLTKEDANTTAESVDKFTEICRKIQETGDDDEAAITARVSHPFQVKERPIRMNIPNAVQLPAKSFQEKIKDTAALTAQFPVSSGSTHRKNEIKELDWKPVKKGREATKDSVDTKDTGKTIKKDIGTAMAPLTSGISLDASENSSKPILSVAPSPCRDKDLEIALKNMTIPQVMTKRVEALQRLQRDPADLDAKKLHEVTEKVIREWSRSKQQPGQLTNAVDTSVKFLSPAELQEGPQAWVKKDQLQKARAVEGGIGMALLQKMGWKPGTALGKNREGALEPLLPAIKMDRKGLVAQEEAIAKDFCVNVTIPNRSARANAQLQEVLATSLGGKHPVSALIELCTAQKLPAPEFIEMPAFGPDHKKTFLYKVLVNGKPYQSMERSPNKKLAKAAAALVALNEMGAVVGIEKAPRMSLLSHSAHEVPTRVSAPTGNLATHDMFQPLKCTDPSKMASNFLTSFHMGIGAAMPPSKPRSQTSTVPSSQTAQDHRLAPHYPTDGSSYPLWTNIGSNGGQIQGIQGPVKAGIMGSPTMVPHPNQGISSSGNTDAGDVSQRPAMPSPYEAYFTGSQLCNFYADPCSSYGFLGENDSMEAQGRFGDKCIANNQRIASMPTAVVAPSRVPPDRNIMCPPKT